MRKGFTRKPREDAPGTEVVAWAASNGDRSENADDQYGKRRLRQIDGRICFLSTRIEAAEVVDPEKPRTGQAAARAYFGATVRFENAEGTERVVSIVGPDEVDLERNHISWLSPLGRALMKPAEGDTVLVQAPGGTTSLTVLEICYQRIAVGPFREPAGAESSGRKGARGGSPADGDWVGEGCGFRVWGLDGWGGESTGWIVGKLYGVWRSGYYALHIPSA